MEILQAISTRKSVRSYKPEQIPETVLNTILKAGCAAPVGSSLYDSLHITVIQNRKILNQIGNAVTEMVSNVLHKRLDKNFGASTMIVISSKTTQIPGIEYANAACVLENMVLAATGMGIGSILWGGAAVVIEQDEHLKKAVGIPDGFSPVLCASFGYSAVEEKVKHHEISVNRVCEEA